MKQNQNNIEKILAGNPIIPVATFNSTEEVEPVIERLIKQNIHCIEITLRTEAAYDCISLIKDKYGSDFCVGMGTVINSTQVIDAQNLHVDFMVSPGISRTLSKTFERSYIPFIPGISTPSEIIKAVNLGYNILKFFPANIFGGIDSVKAYGQVFPNVKFCPTGGITEKNYKDYLSLNNVIAVGGSWLLK